VRAATPAGWAAFASNSGSTHTVIVLNQLTGTLENALAGLAAHRAAGTAVDRIECGNEMYDSSRPDVVAAYPTGRNYTDKMVSWAARVKREHPRADVALLAMTWRPEMDARATAWNDEVFNVPPELLSNITAATMHPYFGISWQPPPGPPQPLPPAGGCGTVGSGASGSWVATETGCADACCCAERCAARSADCRAWQWMDAGASDILRCHALTCFLSDDWSLGSKPRRHQPAAAAGEKVVYCVCVSE
jgi:hypothetical protein